MTRNSLLPRSIVIADEGFSRINNSLKREGTKGEAFEAFRETENGEVPSQRNSDQEIRKAGTTEEEAALAQNYLARQEALPRQEVEASKNCRWEKRG